MRKELWGGRWLPETRTRSPRFGRFLPAPRKSAAVEEAGFLSILGMRVSARRAGAQVSFCL